MFSNVPCWGFSWCKLIQFSLSAVFLLNVTFRLFAQRLEQSEVDTFALSMSSFSINTVLHSLRQRANIILISQKTTYDLPSCASFSVFYENDLKINWTYIDISLSDIATQ